ncbi:hypothetical protein VNI00_005463 [Paramarasmius palmivorus]|uniref:Uncharacterized protein n=1 Tax=Paramarasmius palmivorus TaxID=297713 RepID=A0AAW0DDR5_9AGAR
MQELKTQSRRSIQTMMPRRVIFTFVEGPRLLLTVVEFDDNADNIQVYEAGTTVNMKVNMVAHHTGYAVCFSAFSIRASSLIKVTTVECLYRKRCIFKSATTTCFMMHFQVDLKAQKPISELFLWPVYADESIGPSKWPKNGT